jgi:hypothetical protein
MSFPPPTPAPTMLMKIQNEKVLYHFQIEVYK